MTSGLPDHFGRLLKDVEGQVGVSFQAVQLGYGGFEPSSEFLLCHCCSSY